MNKKSIVLSGVSTSWWRNNSTFLVRKQSIKVIPCLKNLDANPMEEDMKSTDKKLTTIDQVSYNIFVILSLSFEAYPYSISIMVGDTFENWSVKV